MKNLIFLTMTLAMFATSLTAQEIGISGELRPRYEYRHGYKTLASTNNDAANFISQRIRLNVDYKSEKINVFFAIQNVSVWGDVSTLSPSSKNGIAFHEAWAEYFFSDKFSMKLGRQEISYDDQRIFGSVGWAQQARSHDAILLKFKTSEKSNLHVGIAMNANGESLFETDYDVNQYKNLQYAWYHTNFSEAFGLSALFLNNGMQYKTYENDERKNAYSQTMGARLTYNKNKFNIDGASYFQTGNTPDENDKVDLSAYYFTVNAKFKITDNFTAGAGIEVLSGNDQDSNSSDDNAFKPFYGTNHKFNGWMDYFYVGSHMKSVGLTDINIPLIYKKGKFSAVLIPHFFYAQGKVYDQINRKDADDYLGTEIDLALGYKAYKSVMFNIGYSQMLATDTMALLKGGDANETNNWAWVMVTFKPNFFKHSFKK